MTSPSSVRDDIIARRMFFIGLAFLPWLWVVNIMYFWDVLWGKPVSSLLGQGEKVDHDDEEEEPSSSTALTGSSGSSTELSDPRTNLQVRDNMNSSSEMRDSSNLMNPEADVIAKEVCKWVKRSIVGSIVMLSALVAWILIIQNNRSRFSARWFIIPLDDSDRTGW